MNTMSSPLASLLTAQATPRPHHVQLQLVLRSPTTGPSVGVAKLVFIAFLVVDTRIRMPELFYILNEVMANATMSN